jgi:hypothetical protein
MGTNRHHTASVTSTQRRQPKGVKDGGQFAAASNPESSVQLVDHNVDAAADGIDETQRLARHFIRRYGLHDHTVNGYMTADDLTQDAVMAYLVASQTDRPEGVDLPVGVIAKRSIIRALDSGSHRSKGDHSAMRLLDASRVTRETELGRSLTPTELDELAQELRMSLPVSHRPGAGFHRPTARTSSLNAMPEPILDETLFQILTSEDNVNPDDFADGSFGDRAMQLKSNGDQVAARAMVWDAIAQRSGAPLCITTPIGKRAAIRARTNVAQVGGPLSCAQSYLKTGVTSDDFFAPFGPIDDDARRAVCETLVCHEQYADDLWRIAISQAEGRSA